MVKVLVTLVIMVSACPVVSDAQTAKTIRLVKPDTTGGNPIMQVFKERKTSREFSDRKLSIETLSNLLWAAFGINRADGRRTAPSAMNWQEIDIYVALEEGLYIYDAPSHSLQLIAAEDMRSKTGTQSFVRDAPVNIVYVANLSRVRRAAEDDRIMWIGADCGFIAQNVYLYCASEGLACVVRGSIDKPVLAKAMRLRPDQSVILAQTVGYPVR